MSTCSEIDDQVNETEVAIRRFRYRLNRQGMLELDAWLGRLLAADLEAPGVLAAIETVLACEPPELLAMMQGESQVPEVLKAWL